MCSDASWNAAAPEIWHLTWSPVKVQNVEESGSVCLQTEKYEPRLGLQGWGEALLCLCRQVFETCHFEGGICVGSKSYDGLV